MEVYQIIIQDEWSNLYHIGFYKELKKGVVKINEFLNDYNISISEDDLVVYPSTFNCCFDFDIKNLDRYAEDDNVPCMSIRGFMFEIDESLMELVE